MPAWVDLQQGLRRETEKKVGRSEVELETGVEPATRQLWHAQERELANATSEGAVRRRANIDPGLVTEQSLVLATTKYSGHRICIAPGLYAEITLLYQRGSYAPQQWTYADYRSKEVLQFLLEIRSYLMQQRQRQDI